MTDQLDWLAEYQRRIRLRIKQGAQEYGDTSFLSSPLALIEEIQQEIEDIAGWGFLLWTRLERMKRLASKLDTKELLNGDCDETP